MLRRLFTLLSLVSLLLCVATVVLWVRSYHYVLVVTDRAAWSADGERAAIEWNVMYGSVIDWRFQSFPGVISWRREYMQADQLSRISISPEDGIGLEVVSHLPGGNEKSEWGYVAARAEDEIKSLGGWAWWGISYGSGTPTRRVVAAGETWVVHRGLLHYWLPTALFTALPALRIMSFLINRLRASMRERGSCCVSCGYDLRASTERCPECGATVATIPSKLPDRERED